VEVMAHQARPPAGASDLVSAPPGIQLRRRVHLRLIPTRVRGETPIHYRVHPCGLLEPAQHQARRGGTPHRGGPVRPGVQQGRTGPQPARHRHGPGTQRWRKQASSHLDCVCGSVPRGALTNEPGGVAADGARPRVARPDPST
jgi:hypothetical protein